MSRKNLDDLEKRDPSQKLADLVASFQTEIELHKKHACNTKLTILFAEKILARTRNFATCISLLIEDEKSKGKACD